MSGQRNAVSVFLSERESVRSAKDARIRVNESRGRRQGNFFGRGSCGRGGRVLFVVNDHAGVSKALCATESADDDSCDACCRGGSWELGRVFCDPNRSCVFLRVVVGCVARKGEVARAVVGASRFGGSAFRRPYWFRLQVWGEVSKPGVHRCRSHHQFDFLGRVGSACDIGISASDIPPQSCFSHGAFLVAGLVCFSLSWGVAVVEDHFRRDNAGVLFGVFDATCSEPLQ